MFIYSYRGSIIWAKIVDQLLISLSWYPDSPLFDIFTVIDYVGCCYSCRLYSWTHFTLECIEWNHYQAYSMCWCFWWIDIGASSQSTIVWTTLRTSRTLNSFRPILIHSTRISTRFSVVSQHWTTRKACTWWWFAQFISSTWIGWTTSGGRACGWPTISFHIGPSQGVPRSNSSTTFSRECHIHSNSIIARKIAACAWKVLLGSDFLQSSFYCMCVSIKGEIINEICSI